jgi:hypothetical protein
LALSFLSELWGRADLWSLASARILGGCVTESERDRAHGYWKPREGMSARL